MRKSLAYRTPASFGLLSVSCSVLGCKYALNLSGPATSSNPLGETFAQVDQTLWYVTRCGHERRVGCASLRTGPIVRVNRRV